MIEDNQAETSFIIGKSDGWLDHEYKTLEHFQFISHRKIDSRTIEIFVRRKYPERERERNGNERP